MNMINDNTKFELPELKYDYSGLEPLISGKLLELHHSKHHNAYVTGANTAVEQIGEARSNDDTSKINLLTKNYTFNLAGHINHSLFWDNMTPAEKTSFGYKNATDGPVGHLKDAIEAEFESFEKFKKQFSAAAAGVQGSGWAVLVKDELIDSLQILQVHDHQAELALNLKPIILLDVWEHAYYLDYLNVRADYIKNWWELVDWVNAEANYLA